MHDLTILYITANLMPERWVEFQLRTLRDAIDDAPIVSVSRKPMDLGTNIPDDGEHCYWNIYVQMRRAAELAKTPFIAMAEDDVLYSREHFTEFRPENAVSYNRSRWSLFVWDTIYCLRQRISNCTLIAPTGLLVDALREREHKWPDGAPNALVGEVGRQTVSRRLNVQSWPMVEWYSTVPVVQVNHPDGIDEGQRKQRKTHGQLKALDIPFWGPAKELASRYEQRLEATV